MVVKYLLEEYEYLRRKDNEALSNSLCDFVDSQTSKFNVFLYNPREPLPDYVFLLMQLFFAQPLFHLGFQFPIKARNRSSLYAVYEP